MRVCGECDAENADNAKYCAKCGAELKAEQEDVVVCPNCGTNNGAGSRFCVKCGTELVQASPTECPSCGAALVEGAKFCAMCGAPIGAQAARKRAAADRRVGGRINAVKDKVTAFENKHAVIVNALVIAFALVFILVSLLVPVKMYVALDLDSAGGSGSGDSDSAVASTEMQSIEVEQSIWKFFGALGYIGLDIEDEDDKEKITEIIEQYVEAAEEASKEYKEWRKLHEYASEAKCKEQYAEILGEKLSDVNMLAYALAFTSPDVINTFVNEEYGTSTPVDFEEQIEKVLEYMYSASVAAAVEGMISAIAAIAVAAVSAVFAVVAVFGMVGKRTRVRVFTMLTACAVICGVGLLLQAVSPMLVMSGGLFASALFAVCAYLVLGAAEALLGGGNVIVVVKRAVVAAICIAAFFVLCGNVFTVTTTAKADTKVNSELSAPFCLLFDRLMYASLVTELSGYDVIYTGASVASLVIALILSAAIIALMYCSLEFALGAVRKPDKRVSSWYILASSILLLLLAVIPAITGGATKLSAVVEKGEIEMMSKIKARAQVYVSMALSIVAFVLAKLFEPKKKVAAD